MGFVTQAQYVEDLVRYSEQNIQGTARFNAMGGAFSSLGSNLTATSVNPAATATFIRSEFEASLGINTASTKTNYLNETTSGFNLRPSIPQWGLAISIIPEKKRKWISINIGVAYNRMQSYNQNLKMSGSTSDHSLAEFFVNSANGIPSDFLIEDRPFGAHHAYDTYVIDPDTNTFDQYTTQITEGETQDIFFRRRGRMGETMFTTGINFFNRVYIGGGLGYVKTTFEQRDRYYMKNNADNPDLDTYIFNSDLSANGSGINAKIGVIGKVSQNIKIGSYIHTPTLLQVQETFSASMSSEFTNGDEYQSQELEGETSYITTTPMRYGFSVAFANPNFGAMSVEAERTLYQKGKFTSDESFLETTPEDELYFEDITAQAQQLLQPAWNIKMGVEIPTKFCAVRAGFRYLQSPYKTSESEFQTPTMVYSAGLGFKAKRVTIDYSVQYVTRTDDQSPYSTSPDIGESALSNIIGQVTLGWKFDTN